MTQLENLLRSWNTASAIDNCVAFLNDNQGEWTEHELYVAIKHAFVYNPVRIARVNGANGLLVVQAPIVMNSGCFGASLYPRPSVRRR